MNKLEEYLISKPTAELHFATIAKLLKELDDDKLEKAIKLIPAELLGDVALELPDRYFDDIITNRTTDELKIAITALESDDQLDFIQMLEQFDKNIANKLFDNLHKDDQKEITKLKKYKEHEAGAYMQLEVFEAVMDENTHDVIKRFATLKNNNELEHIQNLFITNKQKKLMFTIGLDDLLVFDFKKSLKENIETNKNSFEAHYAKDSDNIKDVVHQFEQFDLPVIPIVDDKGLLIGRITSDDVYDIINSQATKQLYNLSGIDDEAEEDDNTIKIAKTRASWLGVNLFTAIIASLVIGFFQDTINSMVALAVLMPIVASMGGNAGTQTLTVVVRQLALGDIGKNDAKRIIKKELTISLLNGILFAFVISIVAYLWFDIELLGLVIALSMIINILVAGFFGAVVPLLLDNFKIDPAIGSTVVLTTATDIVGFFSFLALATWILL